MKCLYCKQEINDDATVCPYCNAYKTTRGEHRIDKGTYFYSLIFLSTWIGTVGLTWFIVWFGAIIFTGYPIFNEKSLFFQTNSWDCRFKYVNVIHNNPKNPTDAALKSIGVTRRFDDGKPVYLRPSSADLSTIQTKEFAFFKVNENIRSSDTIAPNCDSVENREIVAEKVKKFGTINSLGSKVTYENVSIPEPTFVKGEKSSASFIDYLAGIILSAFILIIGFPTARLVSKIWNAIFVSNQIIWVRRY